MKTIPVKIVAVVGLAGLLAGCESPGGGPNYTGSGALIGGASGAALGAMADSRAPGAGALIGGAAGLIAGGLIGNSMDRQAEARWQSAPPPPPPAYYPPPAAPAAPPPVQPTSLADIKAMARSGTSDDFIIAQINNTHATYHLDADAIIDLQNAGVSQKVIAYMVNLPSPVVAQAPPAPPAERVVVAPGPDYAWVGGEWVWNGASWVWVGGHWVLPPYRHGVWVEAHWVRGPYGWRRVGGYWR